MPTQPYHAVLADLPRAEIFDGQARRTCIVSDNAVMQAIWVEPGHPDFPIDQHECDQTVFIFEGELKLTLNEDDVYIVKPGEVMYIPGGVPHKAEVHGDKTCFGLDVFAPIREEYVALAQHQLDREPAGQK